MMPTVGTVVACVVGSFAVVSVSAALIADRISDNRYKQQVDRMTGPGEFPEEFLLNANDASREGAPKSW